jgi:hypothetical protein
MRETMVVIQQARKIQAAPEKVWSLLTSPAVWSLRPGDYAFDAAPSTGTDRLRIVMSILRSGLVGSDVFGIGGEESGQSLCLNNLSVPQTGRGDLAFFFSVLPARRGTKAVITVHSRVNRRAKGAIRSWWHQQLKPWLAECAAVLEDRRPWPANGLPADVRAACLARRPIGEAVSVSASTLISAPPDRTWRAVWNPATTLLADPDCVAAGQVPGTPSQRVGEMQYFVHRLPDGRLQAQLIAVDDLDEGRTALVHAVNSAWYSEVHHQVEPEAGGTRLTLTTRHYPATVDRPKPYEGDMAARVSRYKSVIETLGAG